MPAAPPARKADDDADASFVSTSSIISDDALGSYVRPSEDEIDELAGDHSFNLSSISAIRPAKGGDDEDEEDEDGESIRSEDTYSEDSRDENDAYSDVDDDGDSVEASFADESYMPDDDDDDDEYDELAESPPESDEEEDEEDEDTEGSVDLEWEEAREMAGAAIKTHARALKAAAVQGFVVEKPKTVKGVVEVVRSLVNTVGAFQESAVNADFILEQLTEYQAILVDEEGRFLFDDKRDLINKYLALVKYVSSSDDIALDVALKDHDIMDDEGRIDLKLLVREMKRLYTEKS